MPEFDAYLMVDWSARNEPMTGKDTVWYCMLIRSEGRLWCCRLENPRTRRDAFTEISGLLAENVGRCVATLVGFDFPYGYPRGFGSAIGLKDQQIPMWRQVWNLLSEKIEDSEENISNRFGVAAELNKRISGGCYPFWGCPKRFECRTLSRRKPLGRFKAELPVKRLTEKRESKTQPVWKLAYRGSVGSQALVGIPHVARLREDTSLSKHSQVWPFETGLKKLPPRGERAWFVLHAEIFPSIIGVTPGKGEVKDAAQVRALARHFAQLDKKGQLSPLFEKPADLCDEDRQTVEYEEGWILGVQ
ncbi:MAG: hypothetical protein V3R29_04450 [Candidatus Acidoferrales bacterium]